jgi:ubiquinone/menaquinone biosynthesis C-methylase UbiE|uniref:Class I SAM-dependent methyltransferase n=1 Tax=candidate division WOR-3 bacterium TaxID=2052148 RepID=A0A7V3VTC5_UNCW3
MIPKKIILSISIQNSIDLSPELCIIYSYMEEPREKWERFWGKKEDRAIYPPVTDIIQELARFTNPYNKMALEAGAGTGRDGIRLARLGARVILLDYSEKSLKLAKKYLAQEDKKLNIQLIMADALKTPFLDESFDIVFHQGLLEHFHKPDPLLKENVRILKKGGVLVVDVPQTFHLYTLIKNILMVLGIWFAGWERQFTINSLSRLLKKYDLEIIHLYGDWSRPGILYKIVRELLLRFNISLPMYPGYLGKITKKFYRLQESLRQKKIFLYTTLSIGMIARKR